MNVYMKTPECVDEDSRSVTAHSSDQSPLSAGGTCYSIYSYTSVHKAYIIYQTYIMYQACIIYQTVTACGQVRKRVHDERICMITLMTNI